MHAPQMSAPSSPPLAALPPAGGDDRSLARLRWRCRRGLLENDLILARFLDARGAAITAAEIAALDRLLDLPDNDLWDLLSGRAEPRDAALEPLLRQLCAA
jgi:antitoxin CptB